MYCPQCGVEYRDGFTECSDCQVALVPGLAPEASGSQVDLVPVFESNDRFAVSLARGLLEDAGIPFWTLGDKMGDETAARLALGPILFPSCRFLVPGDREAEARELLEQLESPEAEQGSS